MDEPPVPIQEPCQSSANTSLGHGAFPAIPHWEGDVIPVECAHTWKFPKIVVPQNGWFIMENLGYPHLWKPPHHFPWYNPNAIRTSYLYKHGVNDGTFPNLLMSEIAEKILKFPISEVRKRHRGVTCLLVVQTPVYESLCHICIYMPYPHCLWNISLSIKSPNHIQYIYIYNYIYIQLYIYTIIYIHTLYMYM